MDHLFSFLLSFIFFFLHRELGRESSDENGAVVRKKAPVAEVFALETFQHEQGKLLEIRLLGRFLLLLDDLLSFKERVLHFVHKSTVTTQAGRMRERFLTLTTAQHLSTKANLTMKLN